ncbi:hypothetical protein ACROYT_G027355 [Oculina patagonica]
MSASQQMLKDVRQSFEQIIQKYPQIKGNLNKCYKEIEDITTHTQATKEAKKIEKKEKIKTLLKKFNDKTFLDKSYEGLVYEGAINEDELIELINKLSKAITDCKKKMLSFASRQGLLLKEAKQTLEPQMFKHVRESYELGQIKFTKMFKPVTSRLDTQIEATKKLENKGLKERDPLPEYPSETEDEDEDEMPPPPPPIEDGDEYEMPEPPPIEDGDEYEMDDYELPPPPPPPPPQKRKKWDTSADQKELDRQRESVAEERRQIEGMRRDTAPDSDREDDEWEGSGLAHNYKAIYYRDPEKLIEKLDVICGSINAGNSSNEVRNQECKIIKTKFVSEKKGRGVGGVGQTINKKIGDKIPVFQQAQDMASAIMAVTGADKDLFKKYWRGDFAKGKAVVIERFNRTLKNKMYKQFTIQGNTQYLKILPKIVKEYNNTKHSSIKMTPTEASKKKNEGTVYFNLYGDMEPLSAKPKFKVGDKVRISKYKRIVFDKGYTPNWSEEMFVITKIQHTNPITYKIKDLNDEEIKGSFYEPELLKAKQDVFRIDKVIRRDYKKKQALVKWKGYNDDFNSWIPMKDLQHI